MKAVGDHETKAKDMYPNEMRAMDKEAKESAREEALRLKAEEEAKEAARLKAQQKAKEAEEAARLKAEEEAQEAARLKAQQKAKEAEKAGLSPAERQLDNQGETGMVARQSSGKTYGDPHMQNILGQRFDLMQPGGHTLVQIPRGASYDESLLRVAAQVSRMGADCQDMYIIEVNVTGAWPEG